MYISKERERERSGQLERDAERDVPDTLDLAVVIVAVVVVVCNHRELYRSNLKPIPAPPQGVANSTLR